MESQVAKSVPERAVSIFKFLQELIKLRHRPAPTLADISRKTGHWVHQLDSTTTVYPNVLFWSSSGMIDSSSVSLLDQTMTSSMSIENVQSPGIILRVPKVVVESPPEPSFSLGPWVNGDIQDSTSEISLFANSGELEEEDQYVTIGDEDEVLPEATSTSEYLKIRDEFSSWYENWQKWASNTNKAAEVRKLYQSLYDTRIQIRDQDQDWEFVLGIGRLKYSTSSKSLDRHLFTVVCDIDLDEISGKLTVRIDESKVFVAEDDWVVGVSKPDIDELKKTVEELNQDDGFNSERFKQVLNRFANKFLPGLITDVNLNASDEADSLKLSPALILRKKSGQDLVKVLEHLEEVTIETEVVSAPFNYILDFDDEDPRLNSEWSTDGAAVFLDDEIYLPLSLNENQRRALRLSESKITTLVQGPPGTGKTRTIATMVTHFLSKGERVLVTAATSQALKEVSSQIPANLRDLVVSNLGKGKSSGDDLQKAVNSLQSANENRSILSDGFEEFEKSTLGGLDSLHRQRMETFREIVDIRALEVGEIELEGVSGTPAHHAYSYLAQSERLRWFQEISDSKATGVLFTPPDAENLKNSLQLIWENSVRVPAEPKLPDRAQLWTSEKLLRASRFQQALEQFGGVTTISPEIAKEVLPTLELVLDNFTRFSSEHIPWMLENTKSVLFGLASPGESERLRQAQSSVLKILEYLEQAGALNEIECGLTSLSWIPILDGLRAFTKQRGDLELNNLGELKTGIFRNSIVKKSKDLLSGVKVLGRFPNNAESLDRILALVRADSEFLNLTTILGIPNDALPGVRTNAIYWLNQLSADIDSVIDTHQQMSLLKGQREKILNDSGLFIGNQLEIVRTISACRSTTAKLQIKELENETKSHIVQLDARFKGERPDYFHQYVQAIENRNITKFELALDLFVQHIEAQEAVHQLRSNVQNLFHPDGLLTQFFWNWIEEAPEETRMIEILETIDGLVDAFRWKRVRDALSQNISGNYDFLFERLKTLDEEIEKEVRELSRRRAWKKALDRIDRETLMYMSRYAIESKKLGAGTGASASRRKREIRGYLEKCTDAIPAWIMPISRIAESFNPQLEMFDVVIVDEASQAGIDALFLLALGKRVVIVGDHKQVSPDAMYMKHDELREIVHRRLGADPRAANWSNPDFSLFDECKSVFGAPLTLTEHRRCVPAIIGFSNEIAYIPDGIRLIPVRQTGSQSLPPVKTVFVPDGYVRGSTSSVINPPEAEKIVDLIEEMINDVSYNGLTIGVITLQGSEQQHEIRKLLIDRIDIQEIERREIRVGIASSFQGSERDVILLSMVMANNKKNFRAQTTENMVQRYNVAMSRAKDQVVLVHSLKLADLKNEMDLRWRLLNYCLDIEAGRGELHTASRNLVPDDTRVSPFDSLFEQRVYNRIVERGYSVIAQYEPNIDGHSYRIDLVVLGTYGKLAVECDGDRWHGPEEYERDLRRQQILESCNWRFFRIQESEFYNNPDSLSELWPMLDALNSIEQKSFFTQNESSFDNSLSESPALDEEGINELEEDAIEVEISSNDEDDDVETHSDFAVNHGSESIENNRSSVTSSPDNFKPLEAEELADGLRVREFSKQLPPEFSWLKPYRSWDREDVSALTHVSLQNKKTRIELREIARVEGPILGSYLMRRHYKAIGGSSLSANNEKLYIRQLENAVLHGELIAEDRAAGTSLATATFRLPEQQPVEMRFRGPRDLYDLPPREVAQIIRNVLRTKPSFDLGVNRELTFRKVLELLDFTKLTRKSEEHLDRIVAEYDAEISR